MVNLFCIYYEYLMKLYDTSYLSKCDFRKYQNCSKFISKFCYFISLFIYLFIFQCVISNVTF